MNKLLVAAIAALCLTFGAIAPASAHNPNVYSYLACGATRLDQQDFVTHSAPINLAPGYLFSYCRATWFDGSHEKQWWAVTSQSTGENQVWGTYRFCYLGDVCAPEPS